MHRTVTRLALIGMGLLSTPAWAQGWADFASAFPMFPCQDGWMACRVDGAAVTPDLQKDNTMALAPPPPLQIPAAPSLALFCLSTWIRVTSILTPEHPSG